MEPESISFNQALEKDDPTAITVMGTSGSQNKTPEWRKDEDGQSTVQQQTYVKCLRHIRCVNDN
jgi:hypothetical protein